VKRRALPLEECRRVLGRFGESLSDAEVELLVERLEDLAEWAISNASCRRPGIAQLPPFPVDDLQRSA